MYREQEASQVGVRVVVVAAVVGLLVLILQGRAVAAEPGELAVRLVDSTLQTEQERLAQARDVLSDARNERIVRLHEHVVESSWSAWTGTSPRRLFSGVRDIARELWSWRERSPAEDSALDRLEAGGSAGPLDAEGRLLYTRLSLREQRERVEETLDGAEWALSSGHHSLARARIERALELDPGCARARELAGQLDEPTADPLRGIDLLSAGTSEPWEARVAAALLTEDYTSAIALAPENPSGSFARGVAEFLSGQPAQAVASLEPLRARDDALGRLASQWVAHEDLNVEAAFAHEKRDYRIRQALGMLGGDRLSQSGIELSPRGYRAWRESMTPLNVAVSMPARMYRGWRPDGEALRAASLQYVAQLPQGPQAEEAIAWLRDIQPAPSAARFSGWEGDRFVLPPAHTVYARLSAAPLLLTKRVLDSVYVSDVPAMRDALGLGGAVLLEARNPEEGDDGIETQAARRFLIELAFAVEQGQLDPMGRTPEATLDAIRRLEGALDAGDILVAEPAEVGDGELVGGFTRAIVDGQNEQIGALALQRGEDDFRMVRQFGQSTVECPSYALCVDRGRLFTGALIGQFDADSRLQLGLQTSVEGAHLSLGLNESGPAVSLVLPIGRWLGLQRWLPLAAYVSVSADSFYVGPAFSR